MFSEKIKGDLVMGYVYHNPPPEKEKKQGEMLIPTLSLIPFIKFQI